MHRPQSTDPRARGRRKSLGAREKQRGESNQHKAEFFNLPEGGFTGHRGLLQSVAMHSLTSFCLFYFSVCIFRVNQLINRSI